MFGNEGSPTAFFNDLIPPALPWGKFVQNFWFCYLGRVKIFYSTMFWYILKIWFSTFSYATPKVAQGYVQTIQILMAAL